MKEKASDHFARNDRGAGCAWRGADLGTWLLTFAAGLNILCVGFRQAEGEIMSVSRRELCSMLPAALIPAILSSEASAQEDKAMPSAIFPFEKLPVRTADSAQYREAMKGKLATGESLEVHETTLAPGGAPHPPHHHAHSEMWMIREGTVEITVNGKSYQLGPGSVGFAFQRRARNQECGHGHGNIFRSGNRAAR